MCTMSSELLRRVQDNPAGFLQELEQELQKRVYMAQYDGVPWAQWLIDLFPSYFTTQDGRVVFADFHEKLWEWVFAIERETRPEPLVQVVFRFGGKSTNAEAAAVYVGGEGIRRYGIYCCNTQTQADDHVANISEMLQSPRVAARYPGLGQPKVDRLSRSLGWKANRLRTAAGFTIDAIGLDRAMRGAKLDDQRPDFFIFDDIDDIDDTADTPRTVGKKEETITRKIIHAGAENAAILCVQNLIHPQSIFSKLVNGTADFLHRRTVVGPIPALKNMTFEKDSEGIVKLTGGTPTWEGFSLERCQAVIEDGGFRAFRVECQHETELATGMFLADVWVEATHVISSFDVPTSWYVDRTYDWGWGRPWACVWWAESDGVTPVSIDGEERRFPKGTLFALTEVYGWTGKPDSGDRKESEDQALTIKRLQKRAPWAKRVHPGAADTMIFQATDGESIAERMKAAAGITWTEAEQGAGSREAGADAIVSRLRASLSSPMERPGLFICRTCPNIIRTFPSLPEDPVKDGDVDTDAEDHLWDLTRYRVHSKRRYTKRVKMGI